MGMQILTFYRKLQNEYDNNQNNKNDKDYSFDFAIYIPKYFT